MKLSLELVNAEKYLDLVCQELRIDKLMVTSKNRKRELCEARQISAYLIRKHTRLSQADTALLINYNDHASVWRDENNVPDLLKFNSEFRLKMLPVIQKAERLHENLLQVSNEIYPEFKYDVFDFYSEVAYDEFNHTPDEKDSFNTFFLTPDSTGIRARA